MKKFIGGIGIIALLMLALPAIAVTPLYKIQYQGSGSSEYFPPVPDPWGYTSINDHAISLSGVIIHTTNEKFKGQGIFHDRDIKLKANLETSWCENVLDLNVFFRCGGYADVSLKNKRLGKVSYRLHLYDQGEEGQFFLLYMTFPEDFTTCYSPPCYNDQLQLWYSDITFKVK